MLLSPSSRRDARRAAMAVLAAAIILFPLLAARPAGAQETPRLTGQVTDLAGVLGGDTASIQPALDRLQNDHGLQLFVLFVNTTGSQSATEFALAVANLNTFGKDDALFLVAIQDTSYATWFSEERTDITEEEIDRVTNESVIPLLSLGDWPGAAIAMANGLGDVTGSDSGSSGTTVLIVLLVIFGIVALGLAAFFIIRRIRSERREREAEEERDRQTGQLAKQANQLLLQTDDALREATQELGFAEAQFEEAEVAPFRDALARAKQSLAAAFALRQQLDDDKPEDPETRRKMLAEIIGNCQSGAEALKAERARIDELRALETNAPALLASIPELADRAEAALPGGRDALERLAGYAPSIVAPVQGNLVEAEKRLLYARNRAAEGQQAVAAGKNREAADAGRQAQAALAEATTLIDAVSAQERAASSARANLSGELAAAAADIAAAQDVVQRGQVQDQVDDVARAQALLQQAQQEAANPQADVLAALKLATDANAAADVILERVRSLDEQRKRDEAAAQSTLQQADSAYRRAADFIGSRGSGVGREARTRLAEAERRLEAARALVASDVSRAVGEARQAQQLATDALNLAQDDFSRYDRGRPVPGLPGPTAGPFGGGSSNGGLGGLGGILGGVILGNILTGGMRGGGFGGTPWGSSGAGRRAGGVRIGGGGFRMGGGGGGGRVRGGRW